jgi:predicted acyl esterase
MPRCSTAVRSLAAVLLVAVVAAVVAGCLSPAPASRTVTPEGVVPCIHPYPCGDGSEWPNGLHGPFQPKSFQAFKIPSFDGVLLDGGVVLPDLPAGVKFPTVLLLTPYVGTQNEPGASPGILDYTFDAPVRRIVQEGYAFATVSVRGTANSGGCFGFFQADEKKDAPIVVQWLANQSWSNGRIGGIGVSYPATEALMEAIANPPALKTVVVGGTHGDPYLRVATPQGATNTFFAAGDSTPEFPLLTSFTPPPTSSDPTYATVDHVPAAIQHVCHSGDLERSESLGQFGDDRGKAYWDAQRLSDRFPNVTAAVWYVQGYADRGLAFTDDLAWPLLEKAPKRILTGLWGHELPDGGAEFPDQRVLDFNDRLIAWFDYWLKGIGSAPPGVGTVDFQDGTAGWHQWHAWPPAEARSEALFLTSKGATPAPGSAGPSFRDVPRPGYVPLFFLFRDPTDAGVLLCPDPPGAPATKAVYWSDPMGADTLVAGNPYAYVGLTSDQPAGQLTMVLFDVAPGFSCDVVSGTGARPLGFGAADLRFHAGNFAAQPFPVGTETWVRIDVHAITEPLAAGHRLAVAFTYGDPTERHTQGSGATFTLAGDSFVDLPVVEGSLGGQAAPSGAPPRPFQPAGFPR